MNMWCKDYMKSLLTKNLFTFIFIRIIFWLSWHRLGWKGPLSPVKLNPRKKMLLWWSTPTTHSMTRPSDATFPALLTLNKGCLMRWCSGSSPLQPLLFVNWLFSGFSCILFPTMFCALHCKDWYIHHHF